ncbi:unnamed protein product [Chilo suppressalis]|uniref:Uncharacterized protein n=1 Tax=Chilo suppressalis TaxID=168631 RepID=A0ABN8BBL5_CHISP|nr:unnamed protein product [Chilo suppressalis]
MEPWKVRLETIKEEVLSTIEEFKISNCKTAQASLQSLTSLFIAETRAYIDKLGNDDFVEYTKLQMDAQLLTLAVTPNVSQPGQSRLPKLELAKFNGDILKWSEFWDRFCSSVDTQHISNADKLSYLQATLCKDALAAIEGLNTTNDNYPVPVDILKNRSIAHLYPLEVEESEEKEIVAPEEANKIKDKAKQDSEERSKEDNMERRSQRSAAQIARKRIESWTNQLFSF